MGRYTTSVLRKLHGKTLLGSDHNLQVIRRRASLRLKLGAAQLTHNVDASRLISAKQFEPITLHSLLSDLRVSDFEWLSPPQSGRPALAASRKQKELVEQLIFWLFNEYLVPLLRVRWGPRTLVLTEEFVLHHRDRLDEIRNGLLLSRSVAESDTTSLCPVATGFPRTIRLCAYTMATQDRGADCSANKQP
mgnify:CR=1 FL=1